MKLFGIYVFLVVLIAYGFCCEKRPDLTRKIKNGHYDVYLKNNRVILVVRKFDGTEMINTLITKNPAKCDGETTVKNCVSDDPLTTCILLDDMPHTKIRADPVKEVIEISREIDDPDGQIRDCYQLAEDTQWFGGPERRLQQWPIQDMYFEEEAYVTTHQQSMAIAERYWLSSRGIYIYARDKDPLFLDQNNEMNGHLCLVAKNRNPYQRREKITLNYEIGVFRDPKSAHRNVVERHFGKPTGHPNPIMVEHPIWSTWAQYKVHINEEVVLNFAKEIKDHGFNNSQIEIDDKWETCYGTAEFDSDKFPDVPRLTQELKDLGFGVTLWIHPFVNEECEDSYNEALEKGYFVKNLDDSVSTSWWQSPENGAAAIDFTNQEAVDWWVERLNKLKELGIDSFKFDAGEISWLPQVPNLQTGPKDLQPGIYTTEYANALAERFDDRIELRVGLRSQKLPVFVRMIDKDSRYTRTNGLPTLITTLLQMNMNGYVFVLPDMIGGNGYGDNNPLEESVLPSKDLFIRWLQANVFMPSLQFSFVPWQYDDEAIEISKKFTQLHVEITPKIIELMDKAVDTGEPINPPIWWVDPLNAQAHKINDEFLLGEEFLVAPVIEENAIQRDVYLPAGKWRDANTNKLYHGPIWLKDYPAPLDTLPYFKKE